MRRRAARSVLAAVLGSIVLLIAGCTTMTDGRATPAAAGTAASPPSESVPEAPPVEDISWEDCTANVETAVGGHLDRPLTFQCGTTHVPKDYDHPNDGVYELFLLRAVSTEQTDRIGSLVVNPGGPGASGVDTAIGLALTLPLEIPAHFDIVGFDPRGVGFSAPVECISDSFKDELNAAEPTPRTPEEIDDALDLSAEIADGCEAEYGDELANFNTTYTARDMDRLREALGDEQLTYLGYSYGTTLGSTYAELFPDRVRALVLDGAVDPTKDDLESSEGQAAGFEQAFDAFAADCVSQAGACPAGPDPRALVYQLLDQAEASPIPSSGPSGRTATDGLVFTGVLGALYSQDAWPDLARSLADARAGDSVGILALADGYSRRQPDGSYPNLTDANIAINCDDSNETFTRNQVTGYIADWDAAYPLFGAALASGLLTCTMWHATRHPLPERDAAGSAPILVVGTIGDPATPYQGAVTMAEQLQAGVLLTWEGEGHTAFPKTDCITNAVVGYLVDLTVPDDGTTCPA
ncbi:MAG: alpha/beta fold hydrolase [Geodermatophilaceae bacterium]|nr:alpha/beta fold hydrolase [Geodermatophilaceae bacterium]